MEKLSVKEMLKEMEDYGVTEDDIRKEYEYECNESDQSEEMKNISFEEYVKGYYMGGYYIKEEDY